MKRCKMKALKRFLLLALALIMCMSLFACSDDSTDDTPSTDDPAVVDPSNPSDDPADDKPSGGSTKVENDYIVDYQILEDGKFYIDYEGTAPEEVLFGGATVAVSELYEPFWNIVDDKLEIELEGDMMGAKQDKVLKYSTDKKEYTTYLTVNPITDNYFVVDGGEASYKLAIAGIESAKFNGTDVASVTGITKDATGLTFTKELLATKLGHNKVEVKTADKTYVVSVCAVTQAELDTAITFEDGKMTPFMAVFGNDYKVVNAREDAPSVIKNAYTTTGGSSTSSGTGLTYAVGASGQSKPNTYALEIDHKAGSPESLRVYVSSFYLRERLASMLTFDQPSTMPNGKSQYYGKVAAEHFFNDGWKMCLRQLATEFDLHGGQAQYYSSVLGNDLESCANSYFTASKQPANVRCFFNKEAYDLMIASDGTLITSYLTIVYQDMTTTADSHKLYVDDLGGFIYNSVSNQPAFTIPVKA